jgi:uncharacterized short protein YbdD (DUF466 family)
MTPNPVAMSSSGRASMLRLAWEWLRQVSGDAAYENYLRCGRHASHGAPDGPGRASGARLSRKEFYLDSLRRRYSSVSRCC